MADVFSKAKRSQIMQRVKSSKNKSTEVKLIQYFTEETRKAFQQTRLKRFTYDP